MADISKNKYLTNKSGIIELKLGNEKLVINITTYIDKNRNGQVRGIVTDENNTLLSGVEGKMISQDGSVFLTTQSDENGEIYFNNVPENQVYKMFLNLPGKESYESNWLEIVEFFEYKELSFVLVDKNNYSIILGKLQSSSNNSVKDLKMALFTESSDGSLTLTSVVRSNNLGEFIFSNLSQGNYIVAATKDGEKISSKVVNIIGNSKILSIVIQI